MEHQQRRYDIHEAAALLGVAPSTLRYWEEQGVVRSERNPQNNYRTYTLPMLIDASDVAFMRGMGVPVKDLAAAQGATVEELADLLGDTQLGIEARIRELQGRRARLAQQRKVCDLVGALERAGMRQVDAPAVERLYALRSEERWFSLAAEPEHYAVYVDARDASTGIESMALFPGDADGLPEKAPTPAASEGRAVWDARRDAAPCYLECLLQVESDSADDWESPVQALFGEARSRGCRPQHLVAHFLVSAWHGGAKKDLYRAWIACAQAASPR